MYNFVTHSYLFSLNCRAAATPEYTEAADPLLSPQPAPAPRPLSQPHANGLSGPPAPTLVPLPADTPAELGSPRPAPSVDFGSGSPVPAGEHTSRRRPVGSEVGSGPDWTTDSGDNFSPKPNEAQARARADPLARARADPFLGGSSSAAMLLALARAQQLSENSRRVLALGLSPAGADASGGGSAYKPQIFQGSVLIPSAAPRPVTSFTGLAEWVSTARVPGKRAGHLSLGRMPLVGPAPRPPPRGPISAAGDESGVMPAGQEEVWEVGGRAIGLPPFSNLPKTITTASTPTMEPMHSNTSNLLGKEGGGQTEFSADLHEHLRWQRLLKNSLLREGSGASGDATQTLAGLHAKVSLSRPLPSDTLPRHEYGVAHILPRAKAAGSVSDENSIRFRSLALTTYGSGTHISPPHSPKALLLALEEEAAQEQRYKALIDAEKRPDNESYLERRAIRVQARQDAVAALAPPLRAPALNILYKLPPEVLDKLTTYATLVEASEQSLASQNQMPITSIPQENKASLSSLTSRRTVRRSQLKPGGEEMKPVRPQLQRGPDTSRASGKTLAQDGSRVKLGRNTQAELSRVSRATGGRNALAVTTPALNGEVTIKRHEPPESKRTLTSDSFERINFLKKNSLGAPKANLWPEMQVATPYRDYPANTCAHLNLPEVSIGTRLDNGGVDISENVSPWGLNIEADVASKRRYSTEDKKL
jgi:hypothetical protein